MFLYLIFALIAIALGNNVEEKASLDDLITGVFGATPAPVIIPSGDEHDGDEKLCDGGVCVPYYLCENGTINTDGTGLLDIRLPEVCTDYFEICCATGDILPEKVFPPPTSVVDAHSQTCGLRNPDGIGFSITGASNGESEYGEFPWMVAVLKVEMAAGQVLNVYQCGSSLIHPSVVLTAAHCIKGVPPADLKIRAGEWDTQTKNEILAHSDHDVQDYVIHKDFTKGNLHNDIALMFLKTPVKLEQHISTICLPPQDAVFDHARCFASGWGKDQFGKEGKYQVILKKVELPIMPFQPCLESLRKTRLGVRYNLHQSFICAGGEQGKDLCKGDGGGPLVCPVAGHSGHYYQAGIVAWGIGCGEQGTPGVYVNVAKFRNWIDQEISFRKLQSDSYTI